MASQLISSTNPRYIKHPTADSGWVSDGEPLDAGSGIVISNNIAHLRNESYKHLVHAVGDIYPPQDDSTGWGEIDDGSAVIGDPAVVPTDELEISWSRRVSMVFGPFVIPQDRELTDGRKALRRVVVHVGTFNGGTSPLKIYCYLTPNKNNPTLGYYAKATTTTSTAGKVYKKLSLTSTEPSIENYVMPAENGNTVQCRQVYLWIGFKMPAGSDVLSISAYEAATEVPVPPVTEYQEDDFAITTATQTQTITFASAFTSAPIVVAQTNDSTNDLENLNLYVDTVSTTDFTLKFSAVFSGSVRYRAINATTYPVVVERTPISASTYFTASAGFASLTNQDTATITYTSLGATGTQLFLTPQDASNDETAQVFVSQSAGTSIGDTSSNITVSTPITNRVNFIVVK